MTINPHASVVAITTGTQSGLGGAFAGVGGV